MAKTGWQSKTLPVASLHLDAKNPRLGRETIARAPREIIQHLFEHDKALDVAQSIVARGYFPNEPLLAVREDNRYVVVEGNRRLAALKALKEPGLLEGGAARQIEKLARRVIDPELIANVPVVIAPSRRTTDRQIAGKHIGTPVLPWRAENRASFILEKLEEGMTMRNCLMSWDSQHLICRLPDRRALSLIWLVRCPFQKKLRPNWRIGVRNCLRRSAGCSNQQWAVIFCILNRTSITASKERQQAVNLQRVFPSLFRMSL